MALMIIFLPLGVSSQNYKNAVGARLGYPFGFTVKHFFGQQGSIEGILGFRGRSAEGIAMYEHHFYPAKRKEFAFYVGGGGHLGFYNHYPPYWKSDVTRRGAYLAVGLDAILGVEWTFTEIPLNLGFDWKPGFNFYRDTGFLYADFAVSLRYAFR